MKINWGTAIVIAFALYMTFILYFVIEVQRNDKYDNELVVEEYYKHDARFSEEMDKIQRAADLPQKPTISTSEKGVQIDFPSVFQPEKISGKVALYRPSAKKLDFEIPLSGSTLLIPNSTFAGGQWDVTLSWEYEGKSYINKKPIYIQ